MTRSSDVLLLSEVQEKRGASGPLVFVTVRHQLSGPRGLAVEEEQDLVYREPPRPGTMRRPRAMNGSADRTRT